MSFLYLFSALSLNALWPSPLSYLIHTTVPRVERVTFANPIVQMEALGLRECAWVRKDRFRQRIAESCAEWPLQHHYLFPRLQAL